MREQRTKRRGKYVDPALKKARTTGTGVPARPKKSKSSSSGAASSASARASLRKSTKVASAIAAEERERRKKKDEARRRRREQRETEQGKKTEVMPTQEELLAECAETEVKNAESLKELLRLEEEKKRVVVRKKRDVGQVISVRSRAGKQSVSFPKGVDAQKEMFG